MTDTDPRVEAAARAMAEQANDEWSFTCEKPSGCCAEDRAYWRDLARAALAAADKADDRLARVRNNARWDAEVEIAAARRKAERSVAERIAARRADAAERIRREVAEEIARALRAVDPVEWVLAGMDVGRDAAEIAERHAAPHTDPVDGCEACP